MADTQAAAPDKADGDGSSAEQKIIATALKRFERSNTYWSKIREAALEDMRFLLGDSENEWQWPSWALQQRKDDRRPVLTINKLPQHTSQVSNEIRKNPPQATVRPADGKADPDTADVFTGIVRHIWNNGDSTFAIANAAEWQVAGGYGYLRVLTDYVHDGSMEQEIYVRPVIDPTAVYDDPGIQLPTGKDRRWLFVIEDMPRDDFEAEYPDADQADWSGAKAVSGWSTEDVVRVAEYYVVKTRKATLNQYADGLVSFEAHPFGLPAVKTRKVDRQYVCWYKLTATEIIEQRELPDTYIPFARVVGVERVLNGERVVKGMVRNAKDPARMYNFWATAYAERVALSPKAPFIGPAGFMSGYEDQWRNVNNRNIAALEYSLVYGDNGELVPGPQRSPAPEVPQGFVEGMMLASDDIKSTMGQYDASLGAQSNETSGRAIMARQREGDTGSFHYLDNLAKAIEFVSEIIVDIAPKYYDVKRVARIMGEDGSEDFADLDPEQPEAMRKEPTSEGKIKRIYNLGVGRYDVVSSTGPTYTTKRAESAELMTSLAQGDPTLMQKAGDIIVRNFDVPGAEELAKRLKLFLPPNILQAEEQEEGEQQPLPPQVQAAVQQIEQANQMLDAKAQQLQQLQQQIGEEGSGLDAQKAQLAGKAAELQGQMREIELKKQIAIRDLQLEEAKTQAVADQAIVAVRDLIAQHDAHLQEMLAATEATDDGESAAAESQEKAQQQQAVLQSHQELMAGIGQIVQAMLAQTTRPKSMQIQAPSGAVYTGSIQ